MEHVFGRPFTYTQELARELLEKLATGATLSAVCRDENMPRYDHVRAWLVDEECKIGLLSFREAYARAKELQVDAMAERVIELADSPVEAQRIEIKEQGEVIEQKLVAAEHVGQIIEMQEADGTYGRVTLVEAMIGMTVTVRSVVPSRSKKVIMCDNTERTRLQIQARQWLVSKMAPGKYGERVAHQMLDEHGNPARAGVTVIVDGAPAQLE